MGFSLTQQLVLAVVPRVTALVIRMLGVTLRYEDHVASGAERGDLLPNASIYAFWHRSLLVCAYRFRDRRIAILISPSFDGELIARTVERLGFYAVRGSSSRGGAAGLRQMAAAYEAGHACSFTADGPRGPAMVAKAGAVQLAQFVHAGWVGAFEAVPMEAWRLRSWDGFLVPKPFSRVRICWTRAAGVTLPELQAALDEAVAMGAVERDRARELSRL